MKRDRDRGKGETAEPPHDGEGKGKVWVAAEADAGMDELLAVLGYKVKSSDMADVAEKLEQLEMAMGSTAVMEDSDDFDGGAAAASILSTDAVHYNPSDLSGWVESMLSELNNYASVNPASITIPDESPAPTDVVDDDDLRAIPRQAILKFENDSPNWTHKRMKPSPGSEIGDPQPPRSVVVLDSQETGVRLVHTLMACAEAIQKNNMNLADALVKHVGALAVSQIGAMRKVATYFAEALARKIYNIHPVDSLPADDLQMHFFETAPYLKFAHFTNNQAIREAFETAPKVHVIDFSLKQGMQWPSLLQALAGRPAGPPEVRLTGVGIKPDTAESLNQVGQKLHQLAQILGIQKFEFSGVVTNSLAELNADMLDIRKDESLAVNSVFELHQLLARPGGIERLLTTIKSLHPKVVTIAEQEANHNVDIFLNRFNEALHYYSTMFDSLESGQTVGPSSESLVMSEVYLGREICNVVACEGEERVERHETSEQWRGRMHRAGFELAHLGSSAYKQASTLLALCGDGYSVVEEEGCLMLGWHTRPLIATSAWRLPGHA